MRWKLAVGVAEQLLNWNLAGATLSLWIVGTSADEKVDSSSGNQAVPDKLKSIRSDDAYEGRHVLGPTAIFDAIEESIYPAGALQSGDAVYMITDGMDNASRITAAKLAATLQSSAVRLFILPILFDDFDGRSETPKLSTGQKKELEKLRELAESSGGNYFPAIGVDAHGRKAKSLDHDSLAALGKNLNTFNLGLVNSYRMEFHLAEPVMKLQDWHLTFVDAKQHMRSSKTPA